MKSIRLSPILVAVLNLAAAVLYYVFPTHIPLNWELGKQQEFILAGIALGCSVLSVLIFLVANRRVFVRAPRWQQLCGHLLSLAALVFVLIENASKFSLAFKYDFVPVMSSSAVGVWMLIVSALLVCGAVLHPRKSAPQSVSKNSSETEA